MGVTRLKRKELRNRSKANARQKKIKQLTAVPVIKNIDIEAIKEEFEAKASAKKQTSKDEKASAKAAKAESSPKEEAVKEEKTSAKAPKAESSKEEDTKEEKE